MPEIVKWGVIGSGGIARRRTTPEEIATARNARLAALFDVGADAALGRRGGRRAQSEGAGRLLRIVANRRRYWGLKESVSQDRPQA